MDSVACPFCDNAEIEKRLLYRVRRKKYEFNIVRCERCGLVFMDPRYSSEERINFYTRDYYNQEAEYSYVDERRQYQEREILYKARLKTIEKELGRKGRLLEIGCSFGGFLDYCRKNGWDVAGIDVSDYAMEYCRAEKKLSVFRADFENMEFGKGKYDVIVLIEVIEHLSQPHKVFRKIFNLLEDGGLAVIQTNNIENYYRKWRGKNYFYFMPGHLVYYSRKTIANFLDKYKFSTRHIYLHRELSMFGEIEYALNILKAQEKNRLGWHRIIWIYLISFFRRINCFGRTFNITMVAYAEKRKV